MLRAMDRLVLSHHSVAALMIVVVNMLQLAAGVFPDDVVTGTSAVCGLVLAFGSSAHAAALARLRRVRESRKPAEASG